MLAGAVLVLFFLPLGPFWSGPFWFAWAVFDLHWGRFGDGPFWSVPVGTSVVCGVGKGVYGDVMLARTRADNDDDDDDDSLVMVKSLLSRNDAHVATCRREVELFSRVSHDHVTRLVALCCKMEPLYLVTEYCEWVRLFLRKPPPKDYALLFITFFVVLTVFL